VIKIPLHICILDGERVKKKYWLRHLHKYRLGVEDLSKVDFFPLSRITGIKSLQVSEDTLCPSCKAHPSPVIYQTFHMYNDGERHTKDTHFKINNVEDIYLLVKCPECLSPFLEKKQYVKPKYNKSQIPVTQVISSNEEG